MRAVLTKALEQADLVDEAKKALMYGKDKPTIAAFREKVLLTREIGAADVPYSPIDLERGLDRLHAALGMRSEADEILRHELTVLCGGRVAHSDLVDEAGDLGWYHQLYINALRETVGSVIRRNVAKLITRYKGLTFSAAEAQNPDKTAEAAAQGAA